MPASGLTGVAGVAGVGGGGGESWTRLTLAADYTNPTALIAVVPDTTATIARKATYRLRGWLRVQNVGALSYTITVVMGKEHSSTGLFLSNVYSSSNGTTAGGTTSMNTVVNASGQAAGKVITVWFDAIVIGDSSTDGTTTIYLQLSSSVANTMTMLAGSYYEFAEIVAAP